MKKDGAGDKQQRHKDQLARWAAMHGFTPESGEVVDAFALAMGDNQYGVEETWDAYCWFRNGFNAAGAKLSPSHVATSEWDVRSWWKTAQECGGQVSHEEGWTLIATKDLQALVEPGTLEARVKFVAELAERYCGYRRYESRPPELYIEDKLKAVASSATEPMIYRPVRELIETASDERNSDDYIGKVFRARLDELRVATDGGAKHG